MTGLTITSETTPSGRGALPRGGFARLVARRQPPAFWRRWFGRGPTSFFLLRCRLLLAWTHFTHGKESTASARLIRTRHYVAHSAFPNARAREIVLPTSAHDIDEITRAFASQGRARWPQGGIGEDGRGMVTIDNDEGAVFHLSRAHADALFKTLSFLANCSAPQSKTG